MAVIEISGLSRAFGPVQAVRDLTLELNEGEVFGVLGPNGAGKTTTVRLLNGVLKPDAGRMRVLGLDPASQGKEVRRQTGVLTETPSLYERLSARENLRFSGTLYGLGRAELEARVDAQLDFFKLGPRADDKAGGFSKGMKQRLALARALLHGPKVIFLDEPTAGLDPEAAHQVTQLIEQLSHQAGRTVFLCTHNLDEAQRLCDRLAVLRQGGVLALGSLAELGRTLWRGLWVEMDMQTALRADLRRDLTRQPGVQRVEGEATRLVVHVSREADIPDLVSWLAAQGARLMRVMPRRHTLEEIYFELQEQPEGRPA
ncbi:MAG: ABC transporter ATP-binding protein [Chloroflexi bacterium]|jgi:ABC-2 type transport system ATP-binding protein|nr:ABC transporter ATP-binding protein [Chloroflexota bacterium]